MNDEYPTNVKHVYVHFEPNFIFLGQSTSYCWLASFAPEGIGGGGTSGMSLFLFALFLMLSGRGSTAGAAGSATSGLSLSGCSTLDGSTNDSAEAVSGAASGVPSWRFSLVFSWRSCSRPLRLSTGPAGTRFWPKYGLGWASCGK